MASSRASALKLYRLMLREGNKFSSYNLRKYAVRRVRDAFRDNKSIEDPEKINEALKFAKQNLEMMKRQVIIGNMYKTQSSVIEGGKNHQPPIK